MTTNRRQALRALAVVGVSSLAGCSLGDDSGETATQGDEGTPTDDSGSAGSFTQAAKIAAEDGGPDDRFGAAEVALSENGATALVGSVYDSDPDTGSAYVFQRADGTWTQQAKLGPDNGVEGETFGQAVALSATGDTALVGASYHDNYRGENVGRAYVFARSGETWRQETALDPADGDTDYRFGTAGALSSAGDRALVGAPGAVLPNGETGGAVYVFDRTNGEWEQSTTLLADDGDAGDKFGTTVALSAPGERALVGAIGDEDPNGTTGEPTGGAGSAYVFERTDGEWRQETKLAPDDGDPGDIFGIVSLSAPGETALIGAVGDEDPNGATDERNRGAGSAYVFERTNGGWSQATKIAPDDGDGGDGFGGTTALSGAGTTALVGAVGDEDPNGDGAGSAYSFTAAGGSWRQATKIVPDDGDGGDRFGWAVALATDGSVGLVSAIRDNDPNGENAGSAYLFEG